MNDRTNHRRARLRNRLLTALVATFALLSAGPAAAAPVQSSLSGGQPAPSAGLTACEAWVNGFFQGKFGKQSGWDVDVWSSYHEAYYGMCRR